MTALRLLKGVLFLVLITRPLLAQPILKVEPAAQPTRGVEISLQGDTSHYYVLLSGAVPDAVAEPVAAQLGRAETLKIQHSSPNLARFYRVAVYTLNQPGDQDRDGMDDVFELQHAGLDPLNALDAKSDLDGDGASNLDEYRAHTDPLVSDAPPMLARIAGGGLHSLAVTSDGRLFAWGDNRFGQTGGGNTINRLEPVQIGLGETWSTVAAGGTFSMALTPDGRLFGWGRNANSQLGDGTTTDSLIPKSVTPTRRWKQVACGDFHTLAIDQDGRLWGWGNNQNGELGDGTTTGRKSPVQLSADRKWNWIAAGSTYSLAVDEHGGLWATGKSSAGELGPVQGSRLVVWKQATGPQVWSKVFCRARRVIALERNGSAWCWGSAAPLDAFIAAGSPPGNTPIRLLPDRRIKWAALSQIHSTVLTEDNALFSWDGGDFEIQGNGSATYVRSPVEIPSNSPWVEISAGGVHMMGLRKDGSLWTWGYNRSGQLGQGNVSMRNSPKQVGASTHWEEVVAGNQYLLARNQDGSVWAAGNNVLGQLGSGKLSDSSSLIRVAGGTQWQRVSAGLNFAIGTDLDNRHWYWGGDFASASQSEAIRSPQSILPPFNGVSPRSISSGGTLASMLLLNQIRVLDFELRPTEKYSVGLALPSALVPYDVVGSDVWTSLSSGHNHLLAVAIDGTMWGYGANDFGQLGVGAELSTYSTSLIQVGSDQAWTAAYAGQSKSAAISSDGSLWVWGRVMTASTPSIQYSNLTEPMQFSADRAWQFVSLGSGHSLALDTEGALWAWGENPYGQLGDGTYTSRKDPVPVGGTLRWKSVAAGNLFSAGVATDGTLWTWGDDSVGQLGDGLRNLIPTQIGVGTNWGRPNP